MDGKRRFNRRLIAMVPIAVGLSLLLLVGALGETKDAVFPPPAIGPVTLVAANPEPACAASLGIRHAPVSGVFEHPSQLPPRTRQKLQQPAGVQCVFADQPTDPAPGHDAPPMAEPHITSWSDEEWPPSINATEALSMDETENLGPMSAQPLPFDPLESGLPWSPSEPFLPQLEPLPPNTGELTLAPVSEVFGHPSQPPLLTRQKLLQPTGVLCVFADQPIDPAPGHDAPPMAESTEIFWSDEEWPPPLNATEAPSMGETESLGPMGAEPLPFDPLRSGLPRSPSEPFTPQLEPLPPIAEELWTETPEARVPGATSAPEAPETLGEAPEETKSELQFLRRDSVLLDPGEYQLDVTLNYLVDESDFVFAEIEGDALRIGEARRRHRLLLLPLEFRLGIWQDTQAFVNVPFGWSNSELAFLGTDEYANAGGIGDVSAGITRVLLEKDEIFPDVLGTLAFSAPTGQASVITSLSTPGSSLGEGFWSLTMDLTCIHTYDPVVVFYGLGYRHRFPNEFEGGIKVDPGKQALYRIGFGFAVNPRVTLSASFLGSYIGDDRVNDVRVAGGIREPMYLRFASTIVRDKDRPRTDGPPRTVEPFVRLGMTDEAVDALIGVSWTR